MTPEQFAYWLQGFFEISGRKTLTAEQTKIVLDHLQTVFTKITPSYTDKVTPGPGITIPYTSPFDIYCSAVDDPEKLISLTGQALQCGTPSKLSTKEDFALFLADEIAQKRK